MTSRAFAATLLATLLATVAYAVVARGGEKPTRELGYGQVRFGGLGPEKWAQRYRRARAELELERRHVVTLERALKRQRRIVLEQPHVVEAINLACATFGYCSTLWRKAKCETGGTFDPRAWNPTPVGSEHAQGLFGFLPSTFDSTPFGRFSIASPYANALAAGWMHAHGRGGEWACR